MAHSSHQAPLVHDWAAAGPHAFRAPARVSVNDETLRDGLQNASVVDPPLEAKRRIVHLMDALGIEHASLGIPGAGPRQREEAELLCREIAASRLALRPNLGGRTVVADVEPIAEIAQRTGMALEACLFLGSSPLRQLAEDWDLATMLAHTRAAVGFATGEGLEVTFITEDTTRSTPEVLRALFCAAIESGARRICLCDTAGAAIPAGARNLVEWTAALLRELGSDAGIDWHGHRDRGLGLANTLAALESGATRLHSTALGVGERVGNTATEELLVNLELLGLREAGLTRLPEYAATVAAALEVPIPAHQPIVGRDAFRTASGVHAAAVAKALARGDAWLAERVYSGVPASWLGREQEILVGPLSGRWNVVHFLRRHGRAEDPALVAALLARAKAAARVLEEAELLALVAELEGGR